MSGLYATAQTPSSTDSTANFSKKTSDTYKQVISVVFAGPACGMSLQYDIRFNGTSTGLGARAGIGYVPKYIEGHEEWKGRPSYENIYKPKATIPVGLNYVLAPSVKHMIEFGVGVTYVCGDSLWYDDITTSYAWLGWISMNYRRAVGKHLLMRVGLSAVASKSQVADFPTPEWSLGYRF
ncbi:MAG: hypothetical protein J7623_10985 [Chitinophaga sp.]|uniref:hypothetical protein n=1 Tax=Chitinophaga sp. TaxID=1869181 RepID=UPI001B1377C7|nr:hypothetical protein [Chitinophaga sp.]MBO9729149.1 hypothetical protein [Chitinophaga sp.]